MYSHASESVVCFTVLSGTPGHTFIHVQPLRARKEMKEEGNSVFLCGGGDNCIAQKKESCMIVSRREVSKGQPDPYLIWGHQYSGTLTGQSSAA